MWNLLLGAIIALGVDRLFKVAWDEVQSFRSGRRWARIDDALRNVEALTGRLEIVQTGWSAGSFEEGDLQIQLDGKYEVPADVRGEILEPARAGWTEKGHQDNKQCGVRELQIVRTTDDVVRRPAHEIRINAHTYRWFEAKATNFKWSEGDSHGCLEKYAAHATHDSHAQQFPTPLSVGLSLFCEGGKKLVLPERTRSESAGGGHCPGQVYNAVGENCAPVDAYGELDGKPHLSVIRTALRGLLEEMGLDYRQLSDPEPILHTFCWDREILDYKFFGYVVSPLPFEVVKFFWKHATDKAENRDIFPHDVHNQIGVSRLIERMLRNRTQWSPEVCMCTLMSLLHMKRLSMTDLIALAGKHADYGSPE